MVYRKGELTKAGIDRGWPHQVALPAEVIRGRNYTIAMKSGEPFAVAAIWERWQRPASEECLRTFCIITCPANKLVSSIHDRMPVIIPRESYDRWLANIEPDPRNLLVPYPSEPTSPITTTRRSWSALPKRTICATFAAAPCAWSVFRSGADCDRH